MEHESIRTQILCPLFTLLPKELRDLVFEYALRESESHDTERTLQRNAFEVGVKLPNHPASDIAVPLLRTCRAIYLETWTAPLSLNPHIAYNVQPRGNLGVKLHELHPWQLALIQSLDVTVLQTALEGASGLHRYLHSDDVCWHPRRRHDGAYVAPREYKTSCGRRRAMTAFPHSFNACLIPAPSTSPPPRHVLAHLLASQPSHPDDAALQPPWRAAARVALARPLARLTLRLGHADWWTWTDDPACTRDTQRLALDPACGDGGDDPGSRPTASRMRCLAALRRSGQHPAVMPGVGWAATIAAMPDLRSLELVLETFRAKQKQLEDVVDAAKTWVFPLEGGMWELAWDGEVRASGWSGGGGTGMERGRGGWWDGNREFEERRIRFARKRKVG
jgi:hypothetical protein